MNYVFNNPTTTPTPVTITPEIAQDMLIHNKNRKLRNKRVDDLANEMTKGNWRVSNDDICFDVNGNLINGQHRLNAVVKSGVTIQAFIKYGLPVESFDVMDTPQNRNAVDVFEHKYSEMTNAKLSSTAGILSAFIGAKDYDGTRSNDLASKMTIEERAAYVYEHQGIAALALHIKSATAGPMKRVPFAVACISAYINGMKIEDIDALIEVGKNNTLNKDKYNVKVVLDHMVDLRKARSAGGYRLPEEEEWEKVIYKFVNNVNSIRKKEELYPCTKETIKAADEKLRREML